METNKPKTLRAVGYCRTSGEKQRNNTSIGRQKEAIESFVKHKNWQFKRHYIDECKSGSSIEGRHAFQRMMKDAELNEFDVIVPYVIDRFARDGCDIIYNARTLKDRHSVFTVAVNSPFNNFDSQNVISDYVDAGMAEQEKLNIVKRTMGGRIKKAQEGKQWSPKLPTGRSYNKDRNKWNVNAEGRKLKEVLMRYADGEGMKSLALKYNYPSAMSITRKVRESQLAGIYQAKFTCKDLSEYNVTIPVRAVPEVIDLRLMKRVKDRLNHNRTWNQQNTRHYLLTGFLYCQHCGHSLYAQNQNGIVYYRHSNYYADDRDKQCPFNSVRADVIENKALDYLFSFFLDEQAYNDAVKNAMPNDDDRLALEDDVKLIKKQLLKIDKEERNIIRAIRDGAKTTRIVIAEQERIEQERQILEVKLKELEQTLVNMPERQCKERDAKLLRLKLMSKYMNQDWRKLSYIEVRRFLHFLFSDSPKANNYGILVASNCKKRKKAEWTITFEGCIESGGDTKWIEKIVKEAELATGKIWDNVRDAKQVLKELRELSTPKAKKIYDHTTDYL